MQGQLNEEIGWVYCLLAFLSDGVKSLHVNPCFAIHIQGGKKASNISEYSDLPCLHEIVLNQAALLNRRVLLPATRSSAAEYQ
jgi:hypothetical protein